MAELTSSAMLLCQWNGSCTILIMYIHKAWYYWRVRKTTNQMITFWPQVFFIHPRRNLCSFRGGLFLALILDPFNPCRGSALHLLGAHRCSCLGLDKSSWSGSLCLHHLAAAAVPYLGHELVIIIFVSRAVCAPLISPAWCLASHVTSFVQLMEAHSDLRKSLISISQ